MIGDPRSGVLCILVKFAVPDLAREVLLRLSLKSGR